MTSYPICFLETAMGRSRKVQSNPNSEYLQAVQRCLGELFTIHYSQKDKLLKSFWIFKHGRNIYVSLSLPVAVSKLDIQPYILSKKTAKSITYFT